MHKIAFVRVPPDATGGGFSIQGMYNQASTLLVYLLGGQWTVQNSGMSYGVQLDR